MTKNMIIVFRSRLRPEHEAEYRQFAPEIERLARSRPGFVSIDSYADDSGARVSIVEFESEATLRAWREHPRHLEAQRLGRERFYSEYSITVSSKLREANFHFESDAAQDAAESETTRP